MTTTIDASPDLGTPDTRAASAFLAPCVRTHTAVSGARLRATAKLRRAWHERHDEDGIDEAVTKMIWLAVGIGVAIAATAFFIGVFNTAQSNVPDPVAPTP